MKNTEAYDDWISKVDRLQELLSESAHAMNAYMCSKDPSKIVIAPKINYAAIENMNKRFNEAKEAIEFIKSRVYCYFPD